MSGTDKTPAKKGPTERTAALAARLRTQSDARAARSVDEPLVGASSTLAPVSLLHPAEHDDRGAAAASPVGETAPAGPASPPAAPADTTERPRPRTPRDARAKPATPPLAGPDGRLGNSGEPVRKLSIELPPALIDALARWELAETRRTGQRVYRERLVDMALSRLPDDVDDLIDKARGLPDALRTADPEMLGTRVRESVHARLKLLRPELRVRRAQGVYLRHIYAAALYDTLRALGVDVVLPAADDAG